MKRVFLYLLAASFFLTDAVAIETTSTQGSEFWFSFMRGRDSRVKDFSVIISTDENAYITIENPNTGRKFEKSMTAGEVSEISLDKLASGDAKEANNDQLNSTFGGAQPGVTYTPGSTGGKIDSYTVRPNRAMNTGYIITARKSSTDNTPVNISAYASNLGDSSHDIACLLPTHALGNEYFVVSRYGNTYTSVDMSGSHGWTAEALIVAIEDGTEVEIYPSTLLDDPFGDNLNDGTDVRPLTNPITITLDRGQSYLFRSSDNMLSDLTGTIIKVKDDGGVNKCRKIAVFGGSAHSSNTNSPYTSGDHMYDQLFPIHLLGKKYIVTSTDGNDDRAMIVAVKPNTHVMISGVAGGVKDTIMHTAGTYEFKVDNTTGNYITASEPIEVGLYTSGSSSRPDPAMIRIAPVEQSLDSISFTAYSNGQYSYHQVMVITPTALTNTITITPASGSPVNLQPYFTSLAVPGYWQEGEYSIAKYNINAGVKYTLESTNEIGFVAYVIGYGSTTISYAYSAGSKAMPLPMSYYLNGDPSLNSEVLTAGQCVNGSEPIEFTAVFPYDYQYIEWDFGQDSETPGNPRVVTVPYEDGPSVKHQFPTDKPTAVYTVKMRIARTLGCFDDPNAADYELASFSVNMATETADEKKLCKGATLQCERNASDFTGSINPSDVYYAWFTAGSTTLLGSTNSLTLSDDFGTGKTMTDPVTGKTGKKYYVKTWANGTCEMFIDTFYVVTQDIQKPAAISKILCKGSSLQSARVLSTDYPDPDNIVGNEFFGTPTYTWYKDYTGDINDIKSATPVHTGNTYNYPDDFNTTANYFVLAENGCAVVDEFALKVEAVQAPSSLITNPILCKEATINTTSITNYTPYSEETPPNNFDGTVTYAWYKNYTGDINDIKTAIPVQSASALSSYTLPAADNFGSSATYYRLTESGCAVVEKFNVTVEPIKLAPVVNTQTLCKDSEIQGTITDYSPYSDEMPPNTFVATPTYTWYKDVTDISNIKSETPVHTGKSYSNLPDDFGENPQYFVLAESGCAVVEHFNVTIKPKVETTYPIINPACIGDLLQTNKTESSNTPDFAFYNGSALFAYKWNTGEATQSINIAGTYQQAQQTKKYWVESTKGCMYIDTFEVVIPAQISNEIVATHSKVCGDGNTQVTITATQSGSVTNWKYTLNNGADNILNPSTNSYVIVTNPTATETYTLTSEGACQNLSNSQAVINSVTIIANPPLTTDLIAYSADFVATNKLPITGGTVDFEVITTPSGDYDYVWNMPSFANAAKIIGQKVDAESSYSVIVTDKDGLCKSASNVINIVLGQVILHTIIAPESSNILNKTFAHFDQSGSLLKDSYTYGYTLTIFNRYGQVIETLTNEGWDGTYKGKIADAGVYFYVLKYKTATGEEKINKGSVELIKR